MHFTYRIVLTKNVILKVLRHNDAARWLHSAASMQVTAILPSVDGQPLDLAMRKPSASGRCDREVPVNCAVTLQQSTAPSKGPAFEQAWA